MSDTNSNSTQQEEQPLFLRPAVDIYEQTEGITIRADMPGVSKEQLEVHVEGSNLTIEGKANINIPSESKAQHAEITATCYRRSFTLSNELASDNIRAELNHGVLNLFVPKRAKLQPRKIKIQTG